MVITIGKWLPLSPERETATTLVTNISEIPRENRERLAVLNYNINHAIDKTYSDKTRKLVRLT